ncbi:MAG: SPOR domain-containing protein [bacterium]
MRSLFLFSVLLGFLLISVSTVSQVQGVLSKKWYGNWSVGIGGGPNIYYGQLSVNDYWPVSNTINGWRYSGTFYLIRQFSHVFALRGQVLYGEIAGTKRNYPDGTPYDKYFEGNILDYNLNATINLSNMLFRYKPKRIFFIYGTAGIGLSNWITTTKDLHTHEQIGGSGSSGSWTTALVVPAGLGAYFNIYDKVNLGLEWTLRVVNSEILTMTTGGFQYDMYSFLSLNLVYNFNRRNPVKLDAVESTMPPVILPRPQDLIQQPQKIPPKTTSGETGIAVKPAPGQLQELPAEQVKVTPLPVLQDTLREKVTQSEPPSVKPVQIPGMDADIFYKIQIYACSTGQRSPQNIKAYFKLSQPVTKEFSEGYYRYYVGEFDTEAEANQFADALHAKPGLKAAFVVKYINGRRELTQPK